MLALLYYVIERRVCVCALVDLLASFVNAGNSKKEEERRQPKHRGRSRSRFSCGIPRAQELLYYKIRKARLAIVLDISASCAASSQERRGEHGLVSGAADRKTGAGRYIEIQLLVSGHNVRDASHLLYDKGALYKYSRWGCVHGHCTAGGTIGGGGEGSLMIPLRCVHLQ
jgi:hypothetical protein